MKHHLAGAASLVALMTLGLAACGQRTETASRDADEDASSAYAESDREKPNDPYSTADSGAAYYAETGQAGTDDPYGASPTEGQQTTAQARAVPNTGGVTPAQTEIVEIADIRVKSDAERAAESAFEMADSNSDGLLDRSEYMELAMNVEQSEAPAVSGDIIGEPATPSDEMTTDIPAPEAGAPQTAEAADEAKIDTAFAEAAGDDGELTREELRQSFLARFDEADLDGDEELNDVERQTFAALTSGKPSTTPNE